jgi:DNA invertase Pin-like site-specific DNA recombinase
MRIIAYLYSDPLLESPPDSFIWGVEVERVYIDLGNYQQLELLLQDCKLSPPDYLLVRRLEEFGSNLKEICDRLHALEALMIEIIAIEQNYNTAEISRSTSLQSRVQWLKLIENIQQYQQRQRQKQGHARNRIQGLPPPGKAPYGYYREQGRYILDRTTAPIIKEFFEHYLLYGSLREAIRHLEKRYGKKIAISTGHHWLTNPVYRGYLSYHNKELILGNHTAILSREEAAQIDRLLRRNRTFPPRSASACRSLAGLVFCQACQSAFTIGQVKPRGKEKTYLYLRPQSCPRQPKCRAINYDNILEKIIKTISGELPTTVARLNLPSLDNIKQEIYYKISQKEALIEKLPGLENEGILDREIIELQVYKLKAEIAQLQKKLDQLPPEELKKITKAVALKDFWLGLSEIERRFYFREFIRKIQIMPIENSQSSDWQIRLVFVF